MAFKANETTPLLADSIPKLASDEDSDDTVLGSDDGDGRLLHDATEQPFNHWQIFALCCAAVTEPVACFCIFPFVSEMIQATGGLEESDVGFWAGAIESLFSVVQMGLMIIYGRMSDRFGRKPVLVFSLAGLSISTALFGLSRSLWQMVMFRCLAGSFAGSVLTVRIMVAESCNKSTEGRAFAWFMFARNGGILLGPVIGGAFVDPRLTSGISLFEQYPYLLATGITGAVCLLGTLLVAMFCHETLAEGDKLAKTKIQSMTTWQLLKAPGVASGLYIFGHTMFLALANTAVLPVFLFTSTANGGLGFSPRWISYFLAGLAASQGLWTLMSFPTLKRKMGTRKVMQICSCGWPLLFASMPVLNEVLRRDAIAAFWAVVPVPLIIGGGVAMSFAGAQLLVNDTCPSPTELALLNALTQTLNSAVRAVTPALFTSVFALGAKTQLLDGHLCWVVLIALTVPLQWALFFRAGT
ncbi:Efflux pump azaK [Fulvia fulva]|uniref:Efflux pump azaK n=1 Tax=Passalora fulva TaxID=5499 RepID=A0A9Q8PKR2_PASFU|nr:Efflux pump azaK [Fulvia fulva]KAK4610753.1 Efflux pump azaK [Fulvia fulva]KAK4610806.1 Efflux pump azaK [Fulvia fulva]UJO24273.1 Efflux pump azaK [Fulvia fulva]WPV22259.1 Efflux pump azaK [Fulvia fulva]WPV37268.1 Efflux pump azaK [Fulvia fulva]